MATSRALLGQNETVVNGLVSPTGTPEWLRSHRFAEQRRGGIVPLETAIALLKEHGRQSHQILPMGGLKHRAEFAVAKACAAHDFWLEPTGGIDLKTTRRDPEIALDAASKIIPHIYSSIIDKASGNTRPADVRQLLEMTKQLVK